MRVLPRVLSKNLKVAPQFFISSSTVLYDPLAKVSSIALLKIAYHVCHLTLVKLIGCTFGLSSLF